MSLEFQPHPHAGWTALPAVWHGPTESVRLRQPFRFLADIVNLKNICVFCGSSTGQRSEYVEAAREMGQALARRSIAMIYGGASVGLMGAAADGALDEGGEVTGVLPRQLASKERAHHDLTRLHIVESMHERKAMMSALADGFIAMPGGMGTLEELCEITTWAQLGIHTKPIGLLNVEGYFDGFRVFLDHMVGEGFLPSYHRDLLLIEARPERLLERMAAHEPPRTRRWLDLTES